jgi:hypothetical protein
MSSAVAGFGGLDLSAIPQEASFAIPKQPEKELALLAIWSSGQAFVVWCNDGYIRFEIEESTNAHEVGCVLMDDEAPDHGLIVWEGHMRMGIGGMWPDDDYREPEYVRECWRQPTEDEWVAIREQRNPFEPPPTEELWSFGEKISF